MRAQFLMWIALCTSQLCDSHEGAQTACAEAGLPSLLLTLLHEERPELRAAALYALTSLCSQSTEKGAGGGIGGGVPAAERAHSLPEGGVAEQLPGGLNNGSGPRNGNNGGAAAGGGDGGAAGEAWRLHIGGSAIITMADGAASVRAQLCRLLLSLTRRYSRRCSMRAISYCGCARKRIPQPATHLRYYSSLT